MHYTTAIHDWFYLWLEGAGEKIGKDIETLSDLESVCSRYDLNSVAKKPINGLYLVFCTKEIGDEFLQLHFSFVDDRLAFVFGADNQEDPTQFWTPNFYLEIGTYCIDPILDDHEDEEFLLSDLLYPNGPPLVPHAGFEIRDLIFTNRNISTQALAALDHDNVLAFLEQVKGGYQKSVDAIVTSTEVSNNFEDLAAQYPEEFVYSPPDGYAKRDIPDLNEISPLKLLGYTVGKNNGWSRDRRREFLKRFIVINLPKEVSEQDCQEWGEPLSLQRMSKMRNHLIGNVIRMKKNDPDKYARAILDWELDIDYLNGIILGAENLLITNNSSGGLLAVDDDIPF